MLRKSTGKKWKWVPEGRVHSVSLSQAPGSLLTWGAWFYPWIPLHFAWFSCHGCSGSTVTFIPETCPGSTVDSCTGSGPGQALPLTKYGTRSEGFCWALLLSPLSQGTGTRRFRSKVTGAGSISWTPYLSLSWPYICSYSGQRHTGV